MKKTRIYSIKYKLVTIGVIVSLIAIALLTFFQYTIISSALTKNFNQEQKLILDRTINTIKNADYINLLSEETYVEEQYAVLKQISDYYNTTGTINFSLNLFNHNQDFDLYIIDSNNVIIRTTFEGDLGLDFDQYSYFTDFLDEVRNTQSVVSPRGTLSVASGELTKYSYLTSADGTYIFEVGNKVLTRSAENLNTTFSDFEKELRKDNAFISSAVVYDYTGVSYEKKNGANRVIEESQRVYFEEALESLENVTYTKKMEGITYYYEYIPYEIIDSAGYNERTVIEIVFNDRELKEEIANKMQTSNGLMVISAILAITLSWIIARKMTKPIEILSNGASEIANGNLDIVFQTKTRDEIRKLCDNMNRMVLELKRAKVERDDYEEHLMEKNQEISNQKEEITSLYQGTIELNEALEIQLQLNQENYFQTVRALAHAIDEKDIYTGSHCERVMELSMEIGKELGLKEQELEELKFGSILHDIGKIGIPEHILNKAGSLTDEEYQAIKEHSIKGFQILENLEYLQHSRRIILEHHERIDGKGYPSGLSGDEIFYLAKIVAVADSYDAMTSSRPYRENPLSQEDAIVELLRNKGSQFDDKIVDIFVKYLRKI